MSGYATIFSEGLLKETLAKGPVIISFSVEESFYYYKTGVYQNPNCTKTFEGLNHGEFLIAC